MKAKELIQKWKQEGVSDEVIRKRLIVLSQQQNKSQLKQDLDETQANVLEDQLTQTQIEVPQVNVSKKAMNLAPHFKSLRKLIIFCLAVNLVTLLYLIWASGLQGSKIDDLEQEIKKLQENIEKPAK